MGRINGIADELRVNLAAEYIKRDEDIVNSVLNALECDLFVPSDKIKIVVEKGHLTLSGEVEQYYQKLNAQKAIQNIIGVMSITNNIEVRVAGNTVTLKGIVNSFDEDQEARIAAWSVPGVSNVIDQLLISW